VNDIERPFGPLTNSEIAETMRCSRWTYASDTQSNIRAGAGRGTEREQCTFVLGTRHYFLRRITDGTHRVLWRNSEDLAGDRTMCTPHSPFALAFECKVLLIHKILASEWLLLLNDG